MNLTKQASEISNVGDYSPYGFRTSTSEFPPQLMEQCFERNTTLECLPPDVIATIASYLHFFDIYNLGATGNFQLNYSLQNTHIEYLEVKPRFSVNIVSIVANESCTSPPPSFLHNLKNIRRLKLSVGSPQNTLPSEHVISNLRSLELDLISDMYTWDYTMELAKNMLSLEELRFNVIPLFVDTESSTPFTLPPNLYQTLTKLEIGVCMVFDIQDLPINLVHFSALGTLDAAPKRPDMFDDEHYDDIILPHNFLESLTFLEFRFVDINNIGAARLPSSIRGRARVLTENSYYLSVMSTSAFCKILPPHLLELHAAWIEYNPENQRAFMHLLPRDLTALDLQISNLSPLINLHHLPQSLKSFQCARQPKHFAGGDDDWINDIVRLPSSLEFVQFDRSFNPALWQNVIFTNPNVRISKCKAFSFPSQDTPPLIANSVDKGFEFSTNMIESLGDEAEGTLFEYLYSDNPILDLSALKTLTLIDDSINVAWSTAPPDTTVDEAFQKFTPHYWETMFRKRFRNLSASAPNLTSLVYYIGSNDVSLAVTLSCFPTSLTHLDVQGFPDRSNENELIGDLDLASTLPHLKFLTLRCVRGYHMQNISKTIRSIPQHLTLLAIAGALVCFRWLSRVLPPSMEHCDISDCEVIFPDPVLLKTILQPRHSFSTIGSESPLGWSLSIRGTLLESSAQPCYDTVIMDVNRVVYNPVRYTEELSNFLLASNIHLSGLNLSTSRDYYKRRHYGMVIK